MKKTTNSKLDALFAKPATGKSLKDRYGTKFFTSFENDLKAIIQRAGDGPMPSIRAIRDFINDTYGMNLSYAAVYEHFHRLKRESNR